MKNWNVEELKCWRIEMLNIEDEKCWRIEDWSYWREEEAMKLRDQDEIIVLNFMIIYCHLLTDQEISSLKFLIYFITAVIV